MPRRKPPPELEKPPRRRRGDGSITVLKDGTIRARLPTRIDPKRTAREFRPGQMADAVAWLDSYLHPQIAVAVAEPITLGDWAGTWHETYIEGIRSPNTAKWYLYALRLLDALYVAVLADVRASQLQGVVGQLAARLDPATLQAAVGVWRRCLDAAIEDELIARNPARRLTVPRSAPRQVKRHVTPQEVALLWPAIEGQRFEAAYALLLGCGLRIGEVLGLAWEHVDLANHRAWITRQWTNSHWRELPKGRNPHWARLPARVERALIRHRDSQPPGRVLVFQSPHTNHRGQGQRRRASEPRPWSAQPIRAELTAICAALEIERFTPHAARRGLVTVLLDGGASPAIVAEIAGHADQATTMRHYAGRSDEAREKAAEIVDAYLSGNDSGTESER